MIWGMFVCGLIILVGIFLDYALAISQHKEIDIDEVIATAVCFITSILLIYFSK